MQEPISGECRSHKARCTAGKPRYARCRWRSLRHACKRRTGRGRREGASELGQVLISGSRLPITESGLAQNVTVIDQRQIQESSPARLEDILGRVAGVYLDHAGKTGGFSSLYMRGAENSHLLVMVDGVKMNDPTTTRGSAYDLSSIDVHQVERIEILRGPASAIHGGEALSGVVNIIMKKPTQPGVSGSVYGALWARTTIRSSAAPSRRGAMWCVVNSASGAAEKAAVAMTTASCG